jgi:hypothetical protein
VRETVAVPIPRARRSWGALNADAEFAALRERVLALVRGIAA